jgi:hypothetical protein
VQAPADPNAKREAKGRLAGKRPPRMTGVLVTLIVTVVVTVGWNGLNFTGESAVVTVGATMRAPTSHGWESISVPAATTTSGLQSVACPSTRFCVAVGSSSTRRHAHTKALLEVWNGSRWSFLKEHLLSRPRRPEGPTPFLVPRHHVEVKSMMRAARNQPSVVGR